MEKKSYKQKGELGVVHMMTSEGNRHKIEGRIYYGDSGVSVYGELSKTFIPYNNILMITFSRERRDE